MSIQLAKSSKFLRKIQDKLKLNRIFDAFFIGIQQLYRNVTAESPKVFYHPVTLDTHPYIRDRMYGLNAPRKWSNLEGADLAHYLQFPERTDIKYLIEPNDQILTLGVFFGAKKPSEILKRVDDIKQLIASDNCAGILIGNDSLEDQFKYYFGSDLTKKLYKFEQMRCVPKITEEALKRKALDRTSGLNFLFLASDYKIKAVDILVDSWLSIKDLKGAKLVIGCHNMSEEMLKKVSNCASITIIKQAPLDKARKEQLLRNADVTFCLTHADAFANAFEGLEYGNPIIVSSYHRSKYITQNRNGIVIDFPNEFYWPGEYGINYDSIDEYLGLVASEQKKGAYDDATVQLAKAIESYIENPVQLLDHSLRSLELAHQQSVARSNESLNRIYRELT
jgi:hypothetical protein